ncbi:alpha/beta hydrolase family protein [Duganella levis]|uniref:alpha/beta hydrolase family protein n=1 Tax=Duganella levis TaxID=2692169 RepID=UPI001926DCDD|nr:alpha/beta fold hydrolase [Duganella levis]
MNRFRLSKGIVALWLFIALSATLAAGSACAKEAVGDWSGLLAGQLHIIVHVTKDAGGQYGATLESPDQGSAVMPADKVAIDADHFSFTITSIGGSFAGTWNAEKNGWAGTWTQGQTLALILSRMTSRAAALAPARRPQEEAIAAGPRPYRQEAVNFANERAGIKLAGTLTIPDGDGPFPAVVLICGSGPETRDEEVMGHKVFLVLADALNRRGIAVLRYDKRGVGESTGSYATATIAEFAADAEAALRFVRSHPAIAADRVGLVGHSEGGAVAPMLAVRDPSVQFVVLMAAPGIRIGQLLRLQTARIAKASGTPEADIARRLAFFDKLYADLAVAKSEQQALVVAKTDVAEAVAEQIIPAASADALVTMTTSPWAREAFAYDPIPALRQVKTPVLALNGSRDLQVPAEENLSQISAALQGNSRATVAELPNLNHLFQTAKLGTPAEYGEIEETIAPTALKIISDWVVTHSDPLRLQN